MREANELLIEESVPMNLLVSDHEKGGDSRSTHFDEILRERSPYTGILEQPRNSEKPKIGLTELSESNNRFEMELEDGIQTESWGSHRGIGRLKQVAMVVAILLTFGLGVFGSMLLPGETSDGQEVAKASVLPETTLLIEKKPSVATQESRSEKQPIVSPVVKPVLAEERMIVASPAMKVEPVAEVVPESEEDESLVPFDEMFDAAKRTRGRSKRLAAIRDVIDAYPQSDLALSALAIMLMESPKTHEETIELATRATELNPDNAEAWLALGYAKQLTGAKADASDAYRKCAASSGPKKYVRECKLLK